MNNDLYYKAIKSDKPLAGFIHSFWLLKNESDKDLAGIVIPDGRFELFFSKTATEPFQIMLTGLETKPKPNPPSPNSLVYAISFNHLAAEYVFHCPIADLLDSEKILPNDFWGFTIDDLSDFALFCEKATQKIQSLLSMEIDERKLKLFELIYAANGAITVKELSEKVFWSNRQINRYFNQRFGISLKAYCNIIRFHASFAHIKVGKLYPQQDYADQSHFIRQVKKLSGVLPKDLNKNENDRFVQFSVLPVK